MGDTALQTRLTREKPASYGGGGVKTGATAAWLVLASGKGGTTKTTTCYQIATIAAAQGVMPLLVDTDEQRTLTRWCENRQKTRAKFEAPDLRHISVPLSDVRRAICEVDAADGVELVIVDTPPGMDNRIQFRELLQRSDLVIVPTSQSSADLDSVIEFMGIVTQLKHKAAFLLGKTMPRWKSYQEAKRRLNRYGSVCPVEVRFLADIERCHKPGLGINEVTGMSGVEDFEGVWEFVRRELGNRW